MDLYADESQNQAVLQRSKVDSLNVCNISVLSAVDMLNYWLRMGHMHKEQLKH